MKEVRTRIAPSPTGDPHVGTLYIALFNQIFAKHHNGKFILRIEDTDKARSLPEYEQNIFKSLSWGNIEWDEGPDIGGPFGPYRQSERLEIYHKYANQLLKEGKAYKCFATSEELAEMREMAKTLGKKLGYDRRYRNLSEEEIAQREKEGQSYVIRLKIPLTGECVFEDQIKGQIITPWADIDDQILIKSDGFPTYHLANVVDDHLMKITHVIRGDEWISSTPKHIFLYDAFGWEKPIFMHMPLLLGEDGRKLSKRRNPTSIFFYQDSGYLPEAMANFLTLMGYSMPNDQEIYSLEEIATTFDPSRFGKSGAFFDVHKLDWLNQQYIINKLSEDELLLEIKKWALNDDYLKKLIPLAHTRIKTFGDFLDLCNFFFINNLPLSEDLLVPKKSTKELSALILQTIIFQLEESNAWTSQGMEQASHSSATLFGVHHKKIIMPILFGAIMGKKFGPPLFSSIDLLGKERTRARLMTAIQFLGGISNKKLTELKKCYDKKDCTKFNQ
ncbi:MAG TPA: glutamate--tRNA ligase [Chlamydiales bacterium]|nr:glutamate--tRNA ligase [Chlamydiales bacterium]